MIHHRRGRLGRLWLAAAVLALGLSMASAARAETAAPVRRPALAGQWYPSDPAELRAMVQSFLIRAAPVAPEGRLVGLAAPHAGYPYSGPVAAYAFKLLQDRTFDTVVIVGPSHRVRFDGVAVDLRDYETPLGTVPLDRRLADRVRELAGPLVAATPPALDQEHGIEIQLPFLQATLGSFQLLPVVMGSQDMETCRRLSDALAGAARGRSVLLLASTDLSHFHEAVEARAMDEALAARVAAFQPEALHADLMSGKMEACGGGPLVSVMMAAGKLGADRAGVLHYGHSGQVSGDNSRVVGYLAAAFSEVNRMEHAGPGVDLGLAGDEQRKLIDIAREALDAALDGREYRPPSELPANLMAPRGAFVTLKKHGELRGCIGRLATDQPLAEVVALMAVQAAFHDPRFPRLARKEMDGLSVEISVLTPFEEVSDFSRIEVGVHGLLAVKGSRQGLLLPQVPVEWGWDRDEFLRQTCRKAGLAPDPSQPGLRFYRFSAQVFGEEDGLRP